MIQLPDSAPQIAFRGVSNDFDAAHQPRPLALIGHYLVYMDASNLLALDLRTHAAVVLSEFYPGFITAASANGTLAVDLLGSKGDGHLALL